MSESTGARASRWWWRPLATLVGITVAIGIVVVALGWRYAWEGEAELQAAEEARAKGELRAEVVHLGRAARWGVPLATHDERALDRLETLGARAEAEVELEHALLAYREARASLLASRTARGTSDPPRMRRVEERIAILMGAQEELFGTDISGEGAQVAWHRSRLQSVDAPNPSGWRSLGRAFALLVFAVGSAGFVTSALDATGRVRPTYALSWGAVVLMGCLGLWVFHPDELGPERPGSTPRTTQAERDAGGTQGST